MTAPDMVSVIAAAIRNGQTKMVDPPPGEYGRSLAYTTPEHQARAVLAAICEAGGVEYAVVVDNLSYKFQSPELELAKQFASIHEGQLNTRIKAGPWTAVEG